MQEKLVLTKASESRTKSFQKLSPIEMFPPFTIDFHYKEPPACNKRIAEHIPNASLIVIPDSGHSCAIEQPDLVNETMLDFYKGLEEWFQLFIRRIVYSI